MARRLNASMLAAVDRFLRRERLDLLGKLGRRAFAKSANALDEEGLALGKGRRQCVVEGSGLRLPPCHQRGVACSRPKCRSRGVMVRSEGVGSVVVLMPQKVY